ncbi:outer membrane beta-barrel protein [Rhizobium lemnae]|uniref:Outer membrane beta-barrel protein n=1 Tax=Rhizobium lemnae TaxID=1214924 RepID=A0ABV8E6V6_9HYPH|nr:outer membrane beta-barrel protein [Rhizobium lemnae]MCJ8509542.1 outer membrane beta-barrel protein [Rhizobium lemnae]
MTKRISNDALRQRRLGATLTLLASTILAIPTIASAQSASSSNRNTNATASSGSTARTGSSSTLNETFPIRSTGTGTSTGFGAGQLPSMTDPDSASVTSLTDGEATDPLDQSNNGLSSTASGTTSLATTPLRAGTNMLQGTTLNQADGLIADDLSELTEPQQNTAEEGIEGGEAPAGRGDGLGVKLGTFTLRPSVNQSVNSETTRSGSNTSRRNYLATTLNGTLTSDWARHALTITGSGTWQKNLSGTGQTEPSARLDADLRLDLSNQTVAHVLAGYAFEREDASDPNAIAGTVQQARVDRFSLGGTIERDFGILRGTAALTGTRSLYGSARFADGSSLSLSDRDRNAVEGRIRVGYELSPALIPFIEATLGRALYDDDVDRLGYARSSWSYGGRAGVQLDLGEKLRGELGLGYAIVDYEDARLKSINAFTVDGTLLWSPQRGTDVDLGLRTTVQDATAAGQSGWVDYQLSAGLSHLIRNDLTGRLTASSTLRDYPSTENALNWSLGTGLIWNINRYFDATANVAYEFTDNPGGTDSKQLRAGVGLTLRR